MRSCYPRLLGIIGFCGVFSSASATPTFSFPGSEAWSTEQKDSLAAAGALWSQFITDSITITIAVSYGSIGTALASTSTPMYGYGFDTIRDLMVADAANEASNSIVGSLPTLDGFHAAIPVGNTLQPYLMIGQANLKALGVTNPGNWNASDATIAFSNTASFDFNRSNGVTFSSYDFVTVVVHEIGHALGFTSLVGFGGTNSYISPLDLFRFEKGNIITPANFESATRNLVDNTASIFTDAAFIAEFSPGLVADGRQTSHWKDDVFTGNMIGIMDPTIMNGTFYNPTYADFRALDLIGYDMGYSAVPEITSFSAGLLLLLGAFRRDRRCGVCHS